MAFFKVAYIFRSPVAGWTELFYDESNSLDDYTTVNANEQTSVIAWRGAGVVLQAVKITEEGGLRRSKILRVNLASDFGLNAAGADAPGVSAKVRLNFGGGGGRTLEVRGLRDDASVPQASAAPQLSAQAQAGLDAYVNYITTAGNPYLGKQLASIATEPWKDVVSIQVDADNANWTRVDITDTGLVLTPGTLVYFKGVDRNQLPWLQGIYRTVGQSTTTRFSIPTLYREPIAVTSLRNVQYRRAIYSYPAITSGAFTRFGTRDTRLPFERARGARAALRTR